MNLEVTDKVVVGNVDDEGHASWEQTSVDNVKVLNLDRVVAYDIEGVISAADEVDTVNGHQVVYNVVVPA